MASRERGLSKKQKERASQLSLLFTLELLDSQLGRKAKSPARDKGRRAKTVAPAKAETPKELGTQLRWWRDPARLDFQEVDTPKEAVDKTAGPAAATIPERIARPEPLPRPERERTETAVEAPAEREAAKERVAGKRGERLEKKKPLKEPAAPEPLTEPAVAAPTPTPTPTPTSTAAEEPETLAASPLAQGRDFIMDAETLAGSESPARRFDDNLEAIRLVKQLEKEDRTAAPEEQAILARYSGFGDAAFSGAFRRSRIAGDRDIWTRRGEQLKELTTEDEYQAIERSRINAFYTTPEVVSAMWSGMERMGANSLPHPRVLEPSAGSGRFLGLQPAAMAARSRRTAVELDGLTGRILKHLYPNTEVYAGVGYQDAPIPNDSVDMAISNVPFGNIPVFDPDFTKGRKFLSRQVHNYFFAKTLDKLRPGGVMAFVTTHTTLDAPSAKPIREALAERADLVGAIRLPKGAFPDTEVVTDIIFLRKRLPGEAPGNDRWVDVGEVSTQGRYREITHPVNQYFLDNPWMVLGLHSSSGTMRGADEYGVDPYPDSDLAKDLRAATLHLPAGAINQPVGAIPGRADPSPTPRNVKDGGYVLDASGELLRRRGNGLEKAGLSKTGGERVAKMLEIRDAARAVLESQLQESPDAEVKERQQELNKLYDAFVAKYGYLSLKRNAQLMRFDPDGAFLRALEVQQDVKGAQFAKMPIFADRVVKGLGDPTAATPADALAAALNEKGRLDFERMGVLLNQEPEEVRSKLAKDGLIYKNPVGDWEPSDEYLTGDVRAKLKTAEVAAAANPAFKPNVLALEKVQPEDLTPSQISAGLGAPWIPESDLNRFIKELLDARSPYSGSRARQVRSGQGRFYRYSPDLGMWVKESRIEGNRAKMEGEWGTPRVPAPELINDILNGRLVEVKDKLPDNTTVRNARETIAAQEKAKLIQAEFERWVWDDPERAERLIRLYNDTFNNLRPRVFDGSHQTFPGMDSRWAGQLHQHQKDATWRVVADGTALLAHEVGFGKSAVMAAGGMELRRLGLARKNLYVVPKATHQQFREQFQEVYPYAKILFPDNKDFAPATRPELMSRIATGDWDAVIMSDTQFRRLPLKPETEQEFIESEMKDIRSALDTEAEEQGKSTQTHKELQKALNRMETWLKESQDKSKQVSDDTIFFEDLGVDQLFVDEAQNFKNLRFTTRMSRIKGLPNTASDRAWDLYQKVRYLQRKGGGRGVVFATGTPISNTIAEQYTMMRYLQQPMLERRQIQSFDAWAKTFGAPTEALEQTVKGDFRVAQRFARFNNVPELSHMWQAATDVRVASEVPQMRARQPRLVDDNGRPDRRTVVTAPRSPELDAYMKEVAVRADALKGQPEKGGDNMLSIANDARKAAIDIRLVDPDAPDRKDSKLSLCADKVAEIYRETTPDKGAQLVLMDLGTPKAVDTPVEDSAQDTDTDLAAESQITTDLYNDLKGKLAARGVKPEEVAFIHDAKTGEAKARLFRRVNSGDVRVLLGSTGKMGVGVNVQRRAAALHHVTVPWKPSDLEQREGRVIRQGNDVYGPKLGPDGEVMDEGKGVRIYNYVTEGSFDGYMWQAVEAKAKAIRSLMKRNVTARTIDDVDSIELSASEAKALASGDPNVMRSVQLKNDIGRLQLMKASHQDSQIRARQQAGLLPKQIAATREAVERLKADSGAAKKGLAGPFEMRVAGQGYTERGPAGKALAEKAAEAGDRESRLVGTYRGFGVLARRDPATGVTLSLISRDTGLEHSSTPAQELSGEGALRRLDNLLGGVDSRLKAAEDNLAQSEKALETFKSQADRPFQEQGRLTALLDELAEVEARLQQVEEKDRAEAEAAANRESYFVRLGAGGFERVEGAEPVEITGLEGFGDVELFGYSEGGHYSVSDAKTGMLIRASPQGKQEAVNAARAALERTGRERFNELTQMALDSSGPTPRYAARETEQETRLAAD